MSRRRSLSHKATSLQRRTWAKAKKQEKLKHKTTDPFNWHTDEPETEVNPFPYPADAAPILDEEQQALQTEPLDEEEALQTEPLNEEEALQTEPLDEEEALQTEPLNEEEALQTEPLDEEEALQTEPLDEEEALQTEPLDEEGNKSSLP